MNFRKIPGATRKPSADAWYTEPAKTVLYTEYFGIDTPPAGDGYGKIKQSGSFVDVLDKKFKSSGSFASAVGYKVKISGTFVDVL